MDRSVQQQLGDGTAEGIGGDVASSALGPLTGSVEFLVDDVTVIAPIAVRWDAIDGS